MGSRSTIRTRSVGHPFQNLSDALTHLPGGNFIMTHTVCIPASLKYAVANDGKWVSLILLLIILGHTRVVLWHASVVGMYTAYITSLCYINLHSKNVLKRIIREF